MKQKELNAENKYSFSVKWKKQSFDTKHLVIKMSLIHFSEMKTDVERKRGGKKEERRVKQDKRDGKWVKAMISLLVLFWLRSELREFD